MGQDQDPALADSPLYDLVAIGSSAGGIEALTHLISTLPAGFPAPIVLAQHLDPHRTSHLAEILARRTPLEVRRVQSGAPQPLQPGTIYVVPADRDVEITDNAVLLSKDGPRHPQPSIDLLLRSAARAHGERVIAVILTGSGSDGAAGAREVKAAGGMVIVQNPATAQFPSMPASLAPSTVDLTVDLERIGPLLLGLLMGSYALPSPSPAAHPDDQLPLLLEAIRAHTGIDVQRYKQATILRRLQRRMAALGLPSLRDYLHFVVQHPEEYSRLAASFLIHVTEFFRDQALFAYLRERIVPDLIASARTHGRRLRVWSAGCATGEEAYSLAMLIADQLGAELDSFTVSFYATDIDADAVAFARRGVYPPAALAAVPDDFKARYFTKVDSEYTITRRIRSLVVFGEHDLGRRAPFPQIDLVLCRNVLIYFTPELQRRALRLFAFSLRHDGYLILGTAETADALSEYLAPVEPRLKVYCRQGGVILAPPLPINATPLRDQFPSQTGNLAPAALLRETNPVPDTGISLQPGPPRPQSSLEKLGAVIFSLPVGVVVVDRQYDVQIINRAAYDLLDIARSAQGKDLLHLAGHVPTIPLRAAIDAALRSTPSERHMVSTEIVRTEGVPGVARRLHIACYPHYQKHVADGPEGQADAVILFITGQDDEEILGQDLQLGVERNPLAHSETAPPARTRRSPRAASEGGAAEPAAEVTQAQAAMRELQAGNQELRDANRELLRENAELLAQKEHARAAAEEVNMLNEELQATNEELETINEELEATLEQLHTTTDDLQSRARELEDSEAWQEASRHESEQQQAYFAAILASMSDAAFVVDAAGKVTVTNAAYDGLFNHHGPLVALEDVEGHPLPIDATPQRRVREGLPFTMTFSIRESRGTRRCFQARGDPVQSEGQVLGGVVIIREISADGRSDTST